MSIELLRSLVWMDYRLAVLVTVFIPLTLMVWALLKRAQPIVHLLLIYWRVSSLLAITVYLMIAQMQISFFTSLAALILIPISLWFWIDLNEEITDRRDSLKLGFTAWRWAVTVYCGLAAIAQILFLNCGFSAVTFKAANCQVWLEAPQLFQQMFHAGTKIGTIGFYASGALILYVFYLCYFVLLKLPKQGRTALSL